MRTSTLASAGVFLALTALPAHQPFSRGVLAIDWVLTIGLLAGTRVFWRMVREGLLTAGRAARDDFKRVLIVGAGRAGVSLAKDLLTDRRRDVELIGFVDDDPEKQASTLLGRPILGTTGDLPAIRRRRPVDQVIVAIPSAPPRVLRRIAELARGIREVRVIPSLEALLRGSASIVQSVPVPEATFLGRDAVEMAAAEQSRFYDRKRVLVTGAGGSIGSELSRQLAQRAQGRLERLVLARLRGDAALRRPPPGRRHDGWTRGAGARLRARPAAPARADRDRAAGRDPARGGAQARAHVRGEPAGGAHHERLGQLPPGRARARAARPELHPGLDRQGGGARVRDGRLQARRRDLRAARWPRRRHTRFAAVRFGNVLGSNGSVLPLFHEQIARGGPVTVTDPRATRFFMTIPEACGLILQATRIAQGGEVYVLDMGEPVRVLDMAHNLIRLYGFEPGRDIEVRIIGLRPGEKLHETLVDEAETAEPLADGEAAAHPERRPRTAGAAASCWRRSSSACATATPPRRCGSCGHGADLPRVVRRRALSARSARVSVLAIVPARSGSKSVPHKNVASFRGRPLLAHSVEHGLRARNVDRVLVSTDSPRYRELALAAGAEVPFLRPAELAQDLSTDLEVFAPRARRGWTGTRATGPTCCVHLRPTATHAPGRGRGERRRPAALAIPRRGLGALGGRGAAHAVQDVAADGDGSLRPLLEGPLPESYNLPRQLLPAVYLQNASVDVVRARVVLEQASMTGTRVVPYVMDSLADVDQLARAGRGSTCTPPGEGPPDRPDLRVRPGRRDRQPRARTTSTRARSRCPRASPR